MERNREPQRIVRELGIPKDGGGTGHQKDGLGTEGRNRGPQRMEGKDGTLKERNRGPQRMDGG